jgi:L-ascorbate metabolism protein UlaG (beta-lactamase superfamily)
MIDRPQGLRQERVRSSTQFHGGTFHNLKKVGAGLKGNPLPLLGEYFFGGEERFPRVALPVEDPRPAWLSAPETGLRATWLGHSTVLLEIDGVRVLTDPVFGERASPVSFAGPRRFHRAPVSVAELPEIDAVLISHDHYDHFCAETVSALAKRGVPFVTSLGVGAHLAALGVPASQIVELDWWESHAVRGLSITAAPAQHFSGRGLLRNRTLWSSWALRGERHRVFFSGDTGLTEEFANIGARLGPFDLVMLEVGAFHPAWADIHLGPENALAVHRMLGGGLLMPVHWGTFNLALHAWDEPAETLWSLAERTGTRLFTPRLGAVLEPARHERPTAWWRALKAPGVLTPDLAAS